MPIASDRLTPVLKFLLTMEHIKWPPLQLRRKCARFTLLYKIIHNLTEIPNSYLPTLSPVTITRSNHEQKFLHYHTSIDSYKYSFFQEQYQNGIEG